MNAQEIRQQFIQFFEKKGHKHLPSSSLIPHNDKTLLFANAGMNQFKNYFTGLEKAPHKCAVTVQKCVRAGGKHNDLENVGLTARHHTFFEMLGNFSFGDYFKKDAIKLAWEFLTIVLNIPATKLFVTVHHTDDEAYALWQNEIGIPVDRILRKGDKDNFWAMGETGPCGPCSEIFFDHGEAHANPNFKPNKDQDILDDEERYVEIWNLVFMQYEQRESNRIPLPNPSIDTGAGLERIAAAMQNCYWNYDSDLFINLIKTIESISKKSYQDGKFTTSIRIVADHIRACSMLISDGVVPSNEGRGYVLRRIIRRATRHLGILEAPESSLSHLATIVFTDMKTQYPQNFKNRGLAFKMLDVEELKFRETLENGLRFLDQIKKTDVHNTELSGAAAFKLYDTYGFPLDLTESILAESNISVDTNTFKLLMKERKEESRRSWKGKLNLDTKIFFDLKEKYGATQFVGYDKKTSQAKLLHRIKLSDSTAGLLFKETPFYGESGGQVGDTGILQYDNNEIPILDTIKPVDGIILHVIESATTLPKKKNFTLILDQPQRSKISQNHTATHLLHKTLAEILGEHVKQAGSFVSHEKLRFDFTHMKALTKDELIKIENRVNSFIEQKLNVTQSVQSYQQAVAEGAMALFGEKYGDKVRVISIECASIELCGGTHVKNTSDIKYFKIISESSLSVGIRRIEALTATTAINFLNQRSLILSQLESMLKEPAQTLPLRIEKLSKEVKNKSKQIEKLTDQLSANSSNKLFDSPDQLPKGFTFTTAKSSSAKEMRKLSDLFLDKQKLGFLFLYANSKDKTSIILRGPKEKSPINLKDIFNSLTAKHELRGGGRPDMIQGTTNTISVLKIRDDFKSILTTLLSDDTL